MQSSRERHEVNQSARFSGSDQAINDSKDIVRKITTDSDCRTFTSASDEASMESLWSARKQALWASLAVRPEGTEIWSTDVAVPISRMAELIGKYHCPFPFSYLFL